MTNSSIQMDTDQISWSSGCCQCLLWWDSYITRPSYATHLFTLSSEWKSSSSTRRCSFQVCCVHIHSLRVCVYIISIILYTLFYLFIHLFTYLPVGVSSIFGVFGVPALHSRFAAESWAIYSLSLPNIIYTTHCGWCGGAVLLPEFICMSSAQSEWKAKI